MYTTKKCYLSFLIDNNIVIYPMNFYKFETTKESYEHLEDVRDILKKELGILDLKSIELINEFWSDVDNIGEDIRFLAEEAYYHAFNIIHHPILGDNKPFWYSDEKEMKRIHKLYSKLNKK